MTNLTRIAISARKAIRYGIFGMIFLIVGKVVLDIAIALYLTIFPPGPPPPTVKFGKLSVIPFPEKNIETNYTYVLETPEGGLPVEFTTQAKVFFMPKVNPNLLSLDLAKERAKSLNFSEEDPQQITESIYRFKNPKFPTVLEMNIVNGVFSITYDLNADRTPLEQKPPAAEIAATNFRALLTETDILPEDLSGPTSHSFYKLSDGQLVSVLSLSESDLIKVNLFRKAYEEMPSLTENPNEANVWAIISGSTNKDQQVIASEYHYFPVDESQSSTYPIKTPQQAYDELVAGTVYIADPGSNKKGDTIKIRRVYLAYFDPEVPSDFYQPIFVFEGDNGFTAYTPAVTPDYYGE